MGMKSLEEIRNMMCEELDELAKKGELSAGGLDTIHKITDTIKNIDKIEMIEDDGYSHDGEWKAYGNYDRGNSRGDRRMYTRDGRDMRRGDGNSYARHWVRGHYSRDDARTMMMDELENLMGMASSEKEKEIIRKAMNSLERM